jgi:hypothetical protein
MDAAKAKALKLKASKATGTISAPAPVVPAAKQTYASLSNRLRGITITQRELINKGKADAAAAAKTAKETAEKALAERKALAEKEAAIAMQKADIRDKFLKELILGEKPFSKTYAQSLIATLDGLTDIYVTDNLLRRLVDGLDVDLVSAFLAKLKALKLDITRVLLSNIRAYIVNTQTYFDAKLETATSSESKKIARDALAKITKMDELFIKYRDTTYGIDSAKWIRRVNSSNGASYYFNPDTKESKWELDKDDEENETPGVEFNTLEYWLSNAVDEIKKSKGALSPSAYVENAESYPATVKALTCLIAAKSATTSTSVNSGAPPLSTIAQIGLNAESAVKKANSALKKPSRANNILAKHGVTLGGRTRKSKSKKNKSKKNRN